MNTNQSPANHPATPIKRCASCGVPVHKEPAPGEGLPCGHWIAEADQLEKVITDFDECGETDVPDTALQRFAAMGYLECVHYNVLPAAQEAIDAARAQAKEGGGND